jgi:hypothetical protein
MLVGTQFSKEMPLKLLQSKNDFLITINAWPNFLTLVGNLYLNKSLMQ